ncbi:hypothetical protein SH601_00985 [Gracilibacillus sp. S3-1-1]|uniref:Uncharacterized protein n=1 Tax=Gracilibacillus pellucidus TaxID=3095368 RepID=A0ACC6M0S3_9BACI|nr:hypothetical protein [Gracilibacillus sp. S3-1-1]MDX8044548.1 hypothetical protein [Gracilibacillus sp. S3-1-1]
MEGRTLRNRQDSMAFYITIALGITVLIGAGWFVKSYLDGKTVFNNNSIQQYAYSYNQPRTLNTMEINLPQGLVTEEELDDESEEEEELESDELMVEDSELTDGQTDSTEQVEAATTSYYYKRRSTSNNTSNNNKSYSNSNSSSNSKTNTVRTDVYGN